MRRYSVARESFAERAQAVFPDEALVALEGERGGVRHARPRSARPSARATARSACICS